MWWRWWWQVQRSCDVSEAWESVVVEKLVHDDDDGAASSQRQQLLLAAPSSATRFDTLASEYAKVAQRSGGLTTRIMHTSESNSISEEGAGDGGEDF
ncbi:hypothetical protein Aduo_007629 [Ancylostoma duodenale]